MDDIDLNLLTALDALLDEGSVTGAAKRLSLSPSAMSRTLKRLRKTTGDPLLVRAGRLLVPTPHAVMLRERVHAVAQDAHDLLSPKTDTLDITSLTRSFTLRANAAFIGRFSVALVTAIAETAPGVSLRFAPKPTKAIAPLRDGELDLEIGIVETNAPELVMRGLFQDRFVGVARRGHPLLAQSITLTSLSRYPHVLASPSGEFTGPMAVVLDALGLDAGLNVVVPSFSDALRIAAATDHVTLVPQSCLTSLWNKGRRPLVSFELPSLANCPNGFTISALWHPRLGADPAHRWFRELVIDICSNVDSLP